MPPASEGPPARRRDAEENRARIVAAAREVFATAGFAAPQRLFIECRFRQVVANRSAGFQPDLVEPMSWVALASSDLQKAFIPAFRAEAMTESESAQKEIEKFAETSVRSLLSHIDQAIHDKSFIVGKQFTIADAVLFVITGWAEWIEIDLSEYKNLSRYRAQIAERPAVQKILNLEDS